MYSVKKRILTKIFNKKVVPTTFSGSSFFRYNFDNDSLVEKDCNKDVVEELPLVEKCLIDEHNQTFFDVDAITVIEEKEKKQRFYKLNKNKVKSKLTAYFDVQIEKKAVVRFVTISFPVNTSDSECYRILNLYLTTLRQKKLLLDYLWIAERQKNGTIHYHLITSSYVHIRTWNDLFRAILVRMHDANSDCFGGYNPHRYNGVDVAKDRKTRKLINFANPSNGKAISHYLTKYVSKNDTKMARLCWHCSRNISVLFTAVNCSDKYFDEIVEVERPAVVFRNEIFVCFDYQISSNHVFFSKLKELNILLFDSFS